VAAADVATAAPPVTSAARAGASVSRTTSLMGCLAMGAPAPAPGTVSSAASAAHGEGGGVQAPTSRGELVPHRSSPPRLTTSIPKSLGKRVPAAHAAGTPHSSVPGTPVAGSSSPSCASLAPVIAAARASSGSGCGRVGLCGMDGHQLRGMSERLDLAGASRVNGGRQDRRSTHQQAVGEHNE
jgi:hypothetical protein